MAASLTLDILTPTGPLVLSKSEDGKPSFSKDMEIAGVEIPGLLGEMGVLPGHIPFITPIKPGVLRFKHGGESYRVAVGSGFLEISDEGRVTILADQARVPGDIDPDVASAQRDELRAELAKETRSIDDPIIQTKRQQLEWAECQLRAVQG